jgi:mRNA interferase MazF
MAAYKPGEIVVVPFPFADRPAANKRRPAVVVSAPALAEQTGLYWIAMITSARNDRWPGDIPIPDDPVTGLPAPSVVRPSKLATLDEPRLLHRLGQLPSAQWAELIAYLRANLPER